MCEYRLQQAISGVGSHLDILLRLKVREYTPLLCNYISEPKRPMRKEGAGLKIILQNMSLSTHQEKHQRKAEPQQNTVIHSVGRHHTSQ